MAITNQERVGKALELLKDGLGPFVDREVQDKIKAGGVHMDTIRRFVDDPHLTDKPIDQWDVAALLKLMWETWNDVFRNVLGRAERSLVSEIRGHRNKWAHQNSFSSDDADRTLDSIARLLTAVSAPQADEVNRMKMELRRLVFEEQARSERRRGAGTTVESQATSSLKPWREVVNPHQDVASGGYQQAEFAADLWQVHLGEGTDEYRNPREFFRRTYLTESLKSLLSGAMQRLSGQGGDPVVELQTNFGGGKTHSMLALYHLFSGMPTGELLGIDDLIASAEVAARPDDVKRVVLVGNKISPGNPSAKEDGTVVKTLWGELAWQLGGRAAFDKVRQDDERATNPGDTLRELMNEYGPCLILIDEWVAYARQLHDDSDLPAGSFETHFSFAQTLTESARTANCCLLVISLPSSDTTTSPHAQGEDEEVGGLRGRAALARLKNVIGRVESSWTPASTEEGFEIVRRRLFEPLNEREQFTARDNVSRTFADFYRAQQQEFPAECRDADYERRLRAAYPIHPEVFDRLYTDWSALVKFQRTRGVLRLMAAVIHSLWERGDRNPLIMPAHIPIDDLHVRNELTRYLSDNWTPIIEADVDGPNALPQHIDGEVANLGKFSATRRVARTVYLGSAPTTSVANRGIEDRRIKLGSAMPGETPAIFGDALRRLSTQALRLAGQDSLAVRASKELRSEELLVPALAGTRLRMELDRVPLWRGDHVEIRQLADHFARYLYLPRLAGPEVLIRAIQDGLGLLLWRDESFAYADAFDEATSRYRGLRCGREIPLLSPESDGMLVKPEVAVAQQEAEPAAAATGAGVAESVASGSAGSQPVANTSPEPTSPPHEPKARRFHGAVTLDATRVGRDASQIADEVIAHLAGLVGAKVTVTLEIEAEIPSGAPDHVVRTVTENSRTLKFSSQGFERE